MKISNRADLALILVTFFSSSGWIFSKLALEEMPPFGFIGLRFLMAGLLLGIFCSADFKRLSIGQWQGAAKVGVAQALAMLIWILAVASSSQLGEGGFLTSLYMILVPILGRLFFGSKIKPEVLIAFPVTLAGMALLVLDGGWAFEPAQGLFLLSALFLALHFNLNSTYGRQVPLIPLASIQLMVVGVAGLLTSLWLEQWPAQVSRTAWYWLTLSVVVSTSLRFLLQTWAQKYSDPGKAALLLVLEPVWIALMSIILLGEVMTLQKVAGCMLILLALFISRWRQLSQWKLSV